MKHVSPLLRSKMQSGRSVQRRAFTSVPTEVKVAWLLTDNQALAFESWYKDVLLDGAEWFNCKLKTPLGFEEYVCRFVDIYEGPKLMAVSHWRFSAELEIFERPLMPPGWGDPEAVDYLIGASLFDFAMNREWPEA